MSQPLAPPEAIRSAFLREGFSVVRYTSPVLPPDIGARLEHFLSDGRHASMDWMAERVHERSSPHHLWPDAKSAIVVGLNYGPDHNPLESLEHTERGLISVYARHRDYHDVMKKKLKALARWMVDTYPDHALKLFVDTAPVMEKPLAQQAGLGWQGKHSNLVSRAFGSWLFLGVMLTTLELPADAPEADHCGGCARCIDICPTRAIVAPYQVDARRCISYLTIEHKGPIPKDLRPLMGNHIYGCDDCLSICPWNKFAHVTTTPELTPKPDNHLPLLTELASLDDAAFRARFSGSPIKRTGRNRFVRNVLIAIGNSGQPALAGVAETLLTDAAPEVRGAAAWALLQLDPARFQALQATRAPDPDPEVEAEWG